jgi:hypothetical protein
VERIFGALRWGLALLLLSWPALLNGQLFIFPDSTNYIRAGGAAVSRVLGTAVHSEWYTDAAANNAADSGAQPDSKTQPVLAPSAVNDLENGIIMAGRSPYVGVLMFAAELLGNFWPYAFGLALIQLGLIYVACASFGLLERNAPLVVAAIVGLLTPAAFYNGFLMADALCATGLLAFSLWFAMPNRLSSRQQLFLFLTMVLATTAHLAHIIVLGCAVLTAFAIRSATPGARRALFAAAAAIGIGQLSIVASNSVIERVFGNPPLQVPLLTARFIEDGPGERFVRDHCAAADFTICRLQRTGVPIPTDSQRFLWGTTRDTGLFTVVDIETRRALSKEDSRFALAVWLKYPIAQSGAMLRNGCAQLFDFGIANFNYMSFGVDSLKQIPAYYMAQMQRSLSFRNAWPVATFTAVYASTLVFAFATIIVLWRRRELMPVHNGAFRMVVLISTSGLLCNALICGAISDPHPRYMARLIWIPSLLAVIGALSAGPISRRANSS